MSSLSVDFFFFFFFRHCGVPTQRLVSSAMPTTKRITMRVVIMAVAEADMCMLMKLKPLSSTCAAFSGISILLEGLPIAEGDFSLLLLLEAF